MKEGWEIKRLGEVLQIQNGYAFDSKHFNPSKGLPLIRIRSLKTGTETETNYEGGYDRKYIVNTGDFLVGMDGEFGCYEWKGGPALLNQRVCRLQEFSEAIIPRFLFYGLNDHLKAIEDVTGFATVKHLSSKQILAIKFNIPPLPEQQRIVSIIDEAFERIATAKANAEKNLENARAVFESELNVIFSRKGEGWVERRLGDIFEIASSKRIYENEWTSAGIPFYGGREIVQLAKFGIAESNSYISVRKYEEYASKYDMPRSGDIVMTARGTIGVGYVVQDGDKFYYKDGNVISLRKRAPANPYFVLYAFRTREAKGKTSRLTGTTVVHLSIEKAKELRFHIPDFKTQNYVTQKLDVVEQGTKRLESIYQRKLSALDALKKSLLHEAFTGNL